MIVTKCKSCDAAIVYLTTKAGKQMPVDVETVTPGDEILDLKRHRTHFATCPNANQHRKPR